MSNIDFLNWLSTVDSHLRTRGHRKGVTGVSLQALEEAFERGDSPVAFVRAGVFPNPVSKADRPRLKRPSLALPFLIGILLAIGIGWFTYTTVRQRAIDKFLADADRFPVHYPVEIMRYPFYTDEAVEARVQLEEKIKTFALNPETVVIKSSSQVVEFRPGQFELFGTAEGTNDYGARVSADFYIMMHQPTPGRTEWGLADRQLQSSGGNQIWRGSNVVKWVSKRPGGKYEGPPPEMLEKEPKPPLTDRRRR